MNIGGSLSRRLLLVAGVFIAAAMMFAAVMIYFVLHRFVQGQIDQRLDSQIVFLSSMVQTEANGLIKLTGAADGPPFDRPLNGWYWEVIGPNNVLRSKSLQAAEFDVPDLKNRPPPPRPPPPLPPGHDPPPPPGEHPQPADGSGPKDQPLHYRILKVLGGDAPITIVTSSPRAAVLGPLREAMVTLGTSLAILGGALVLAILLQVRLGLRPLERLRHAVAEVRDGRKQFLPADQPREIDPLVSELNALLRENATNLERSRRHVANLAHSLKTPLATLTLALPKESSRSLELHSLVDTMERHIRHHLGRARIAALNGAMQAHTLIAPRISDLTDVLRKINAKKAVLLNIDIAEVIAVACEPQDVDEMLGNLLENAFRYAKSRIDISACNVGGRQVAILIDDDGPGLADVELSQALRVGQRLDERTLGFGFGLPITRELAELYGGELDLGRSPFGGLRVTLRLPIHTAKSLH